jgi:hypothetical protein
MEEVHWAWLKLMSWMALGALDVVVQANPGPPLATHLIR